MKEPEKQTRSTTLRALAFCSEMGVLVAACLFVGVFLGKYLDRWLDTSPWLLLLFSLLGMAAALRSIILLVKKGIK